MEGIISSEELKELIYMVRRTLLGYDYKKLNNVVFFNNEAVYDYLKKLKCSPNLTISDILDTIEPYIPLALTETSLQMLLDVVNTPQDVEVIEKNFSKSAKIDFLNLLVIINEEEEWKNILDVCERIRSFKETADKSILV